MYELLNGVLSIVGGIYLYLMAIGKIKSKINLDRFSKIMKIGSIVLILIGVIDLIQTLVVNFMPQ